jgi:hypothetical protein
MAEKNRQARQQDGHDEQATDIKVDTEKHAQDLQVNTTQDNPEDIQQVQHRDTKVLQDKGSEPLREPPYSIYPKWKRVVLVYLASVAAFASPVSSSIYFPAMTELARDLNTSLTNISLTITTYMVCNPCAGQK